MTLGWGAGAGAGGEGAAGREGAPERYGFAARALSASMRALAAASLCATSAWAGGLGGSEAGPGAAGAAVFWRAAFFAASWARMAAMSRGAGWWRLAGGEGARGEPGRFAEGEPREDMAVRMRNVQRPLNSINRKDRPLSLRNNTSTMLCRVCPAHLHCVSPRPP